MDGGSCPFCRTEIKGTEQVKIYPFDPSADPKPLEDVRRHFGSISSESGVRGGGSDFDVVDGGVYNLDQPSSSEHSSNEVSICDVKMSHLCKVWQVINTAGFSMEFVFQSHRWSKGINDIVRVPIADLMNTEL